MLIINEDKMCQSLESSYLENINYNARWFEIVSI